MFYAYFNGTIPFCKLSVSMPGYCHENCVQYHNIIEIVPPNSVHFPPSDKESKNGLKF